MGVRRREGRKRLGLKRWYIVECTIMYWSKMRILHVGELLASFGCTCQATTHMKVGYHECILYLL